MKSERLTCVVSGMIAGVPRHGGAAWAVLQYILGLRALGHDVLFVEPVSLTGDEHDGESLERSAAADYFRHVTARCGIESSAALLRAGTRETVGMSYDAVMRFARRADVLINLSGMLQDEALLSAIPVRVYVDLDPAFTQLWQSVAGIDMRFDGHTHFASVGLAIGQPDCRIPTCDRAWIPTLPPVALEHWPPARRIRHDAVTTVANWRGYDSVVHEGVVHGQKVHSLRCFMDLPERARQEFVLALSIDPAEADDLRRLHGSGWKLVSPDRVAATPQRYRGFIRGSRAEFGIAKSGYVVSRSGWFSDRSTCYLASGRPVLAQDTGFSRFVPSGEGLLPFDTIDDVLAGIDALRTDYARHSRAARALAETHFAASVVLPHLLERVGAAA